MAELQYHTAEKNVPQNALQCSMIPINCGEKTPTSNPQTRKKRQNRCRAVIQSAVKIWATPSFTEKESYGKEQNRGAGTALQVKVSGYS